MSFTRTVPTLPRIHRFRECVFDHERGGSAIYTADLDYVEEDMSGRLVRGTRKIIAKLSDDWALHQNEYEQPSKLSQSTVIIRRASWSLIISCSSVSALLAVRCSSRCTGRRRFCR